MIVCSRRSHRQHLQPLSFRCSAFTAQRHRRLSVPSPVLSPTPAEPPFPTQKSPWSTRTPVSRAVRRPRPPASTRSPIWLRAPIVCASKEKDLMRRRDRAYLSTPITWLPWTPTRGRRPYDAGRSTGYRSDHYHRNRTTSYVKTDTQLLDSAVMVRQGNSTQGFVMYNPGVGVNDSGNYSGPGARQIDTYWTNDGIVEMQDLVGSGGSGIGPDLENVAEINYVLVNAPAEFKSATTITTVSKSGTNLFHGSLYYDYNGSRLNARDFFAATVPFTVYNDFAGSIGGPIKKNKTFFFADYEGSRNRRSAVVNGNTPLAAWRTGDFSSLLASGKVVKNPFTGVAVSEQRHPDQPDQSGLAESAKLLLSAAQLRRRRPASGKLVRQSAEPFTISMSSTDGWITTSASGTPYSGASAITARRSSDSAVCCLPLEHTTSSATTSTPSSPTATRSARRCSTRFAPAFLATSATSPAR